MHMRIVLHDLDMGARILAFEANKRAKGPRPCSSMGFTRVQGNHSAEVMHGMLSKKLTNKEKNLNQI